jgi:hypothetical protein
MAPGYEQAAAQLEPLVRLAKVDTEAVPALGARFNIRSIPTLALFRGGREVARQAGAMGAADIVRWVKRAGARFPAPGSALPSPPGSTAGCRRRTCGTPRRTARRRLQLALRSWLARVAGLEDQPRHARDLAKAPLRELGGIERGQHVVQQVVAAEHSPGR